MDLLNVRPAPLYQALSGGAPICRTKLFIADISELRLGKLRIKKKLVESGLSYPCHLSCRLLSHRADMQRYQVTLVADDRLLTLTHHHKGYIHVERAWTMSLLPHVGSVNRHGPAARGKTVPSMHSCILRLFSAKVEAVFLSRALTARGEVPKRILDP